VKTPLLSCVAAWLLVCLAVGPALGAPQGLAESSAQGPTQGSAQGVAQGAPALCGQPIPEPAQLPPDGSGPVVYYIGLCFAAQGNVSSVESETYLYYIKLQPSRPSRGEWVPYDEAAHDTAVADFKRLWATGFLDDLSIEATDYLFANGVTGKIITYHLEERPRVKLVTYQGTKVIDRTQIDERLREKDLALRLDAFLDERTLSRVDKILRDMMSEKGYARAAVSHAVTAAPGGPKLVNVSFTIDQGPNLVIRDMQFVGNRHIADRTLARVMKENREQSLWTVLTGGGSYKEDGFATDAQGIEDYYRDHGYVQARVGTPELRALDESPDGKTRWIQLRVPVVEGVRYRIGTITFEGNQLVPTNTLQQLFTLKEGAWYSQAVVRKGLEKARELYGAAGYMEFTGFPDLSAVTVPELLASGDPVIDVRMKLTEGPQYTVNRITFTGNTTTHDAVIRREVQLVEGGVFNTESLKYSIRRLNQLGYFKPLEGNDKDMKVEKTTEREHAVDVTLAFEEQNRNQVNFGAGVSQFEGVFGNLAYTTTNFMGRGESLTLSAQKGARSSIYQLSFTEPYIFGRPMTGGFDLYSRKTDFLTGVGNVGYSEVRSGFNLTGGHALFRFSRAFLTYGYEVIDTAMSNDLLNQLDSQGSVGVPVFNPFLDEGRHVESRVTPTFVHSTVDNPIFPRSGKKLQFTMPVAGGFLGGTSSYVKPEVESILYIPHTRRTAIGLRAGAGWVRPYGGTQALPYYLHYFLGGEYQIRGVDIRTVGPTDEDNRAIGGNKFVLFNAEYYVDVHRMVRVLAFHDAGQAFADDERVDLRRMRTSSGLEVRFMVPVLNVPFRLIYAWNTYRDVFQPARTFKFAVGTTF
jgi:outer membrane protein insertion porin family